MRNVIQYATAFTAIGCRLRYNSKTGEIDIIESPKDKRKIIDAALSDIALYENTANHEDGIAIFAIVDEIDDQKNTISTDTRRAILHNVLNYADSDGKFYRPVIHSIKVQRSWHVSAKPNDCSYFGEVCTHRGIDIPEGRRGRKSYRLPNEYHTSSSRGIAREQLVTPSVNELYTNIPESKLVVPTSSSNRSPMNIEDVIKSMTPEQASELIEKLKSRL